MNKNWFQSENPKDSFTGKSLGLLLHLFSGDVANSLYSSPIKGTMKYNKPLGYIF